MQITKEQIKKIHTFKSIAKVEDHEYRELVIKTSRGTTNTSKELTYSEAETLLTALKSVAVGKGLWKHPRASKRRFENLAEREDMASPAQLRMIEAMWHEVSIFRDDPVKCEDALRKFLENRFHISHINFVNQGMVGKIVRTLKAMKYTQKPKKAGAENEK